MTLLERDQKYIWHPYTQMKTADAPLPVVKGKGALLIDEHGTEYIDAVASWWVNLHGHAHPYIRQKVHEQFEALEHVIFAGFTHPPAVEIAERLVQVLPDNQARIFFSDNGSTAVEIALKMAIQYFHNLGKPRKRIIAFDQAFHGETFGTMATGGELHLFVPFADFLFEVKRIPTPVPGQEEACLQALRELQAEEPACAFIFEPLVLGAAGMLMYEPDLLDELISICHADGTLCIADEVMTGFYRTGKLFACDYLQQQPDLMCLSKGLTGGTMPLSITTCTAAIYDAFYSDDKMKTFFHGHSYTANPLGCAAANASLDLLQSDHCQQQIADLIASHNAFRARIQSHPAVRTTRQRGTILAVEFENDESTSYFNNLRDHLYRFFLSRGVLLRPLGNVIYVLPPYCITNAQLEQVYGVIEEALELFVNQQLPMEHAEG